MTRRFHCLPGSLTSAGPDFVYTPPSVVGPPVPPIVDHGEQPPSLGRPIDEDDSYTGQVGSLFPGQPLEVNYEPGSSPEGDYIHVLETGDVVTVKAQRSGTLPGGLSVDTNYYVEVLSETSIKLYRDHARTQLVAFSDLSEDCGCVPVRYTWMDQWPPEQAFDQVQAPEQLLEPADYIPVVAFGVTAGFDAQIFLYALCLVFDRMVGTSVGLTASGRVGAFSHARVTLGVQSGCGRTAMQGIGIANALRLTGVQLGFGLATTTGRSFADAVALAGISTGIVVRSGQDDVPGAPTVIPGASVLEALLFNDGPLGDSIDLRNLWLGLSEDDALVAPPADEPEGPTVIPGVSVLEALLFNDGPLGDSLDPRNLWLGLSEDDTLVAPPADEPEGPTVIPGASVLEALLFNDGVPSDSIDAREAWLGLDGMAATVPEVPPEPGGASWLDYDLFSESPLSDTAPMTQLYLGVG